VTAESGLDPNAFSVDRVWSDPSVDEPAVVANLESAAALDRLHNVKILVGANLAEDDITNFQHYASTGITVQSWPESIRPVID
jgi:hypothetical protein